MIHNNIIYDILLPSPCVLAIIIPWEEVAGIEVLVVGCKEAGTDRTTRFVPPTSVVMPTVLEADEAIEDKAPKTLALDDDGCVEAEVTADFVTEVF